MGYRVAVAGATGAVGQEILNILDELRFPADEVIPLASERSVGNEVAFGDDKRLKVKELASFDFEGIDLALFSPGAAVSAIHAPRAAAAGCIVVDNTSQFRMDPDVPLIVPEVNPEALEGFRARNIIANPNCSTIQMVMALKPLHDLARIRRVVVSTYQSVSGAGQEAMDELFEQTKAIYMNDRKAPSVLPKQIAFNCIPRIDSFLEDGSTKEEWKMMVETQKILDPEIEVAATCVRVPVFVGHALSLNVEFEEPLEPDDARNALLRLQRRAGGRSARRGRVRDADRLRRRPRDLRLAHPQGPDRAARPRHVGRRRQSAQGRGAQHRTDRPGADRGRLHLRAP